MRCLVVDDDKASRMVMENFIANHHDLELATSCSSAVEAANVLSQRGVDLMFLDVEMPEMTGIELLASLADPPPVVLVTAKEDYALEAFGLDVLDYLVKPVAYARFLRAVQRAQQRRALAEPAHPNLPHVFVKSDGRLVKLELPSVQWIEAQGDYAVIHTKQRKLLVHTTMKALEDKLPPGAFARVHRSFIVRVDQIDGIEDTTIIIGREVIPIGSSYRDALLQRLNTI